MAMSPKMTCDETEALGREIGAERRWHEKALQDSLLLISRIEKVNKEHEKLARNNKVLLEYIGALKDLSSPTTFRNDIEDMIPVPHHASDLPTLKYRPQCQQALILEPL
ncbi:uncharacterized protein VDAG_09157 [Verticillium dahliae VdLs.17]|uniref:Uncharacterized protein n=1 Tax=Verticillium dahliae (strain VdLs.17 / ATCC MYA-4575 / FGSC 10137) TaxID=498257 RepID=G2XFN3_VERDV|nr:uncharacterized protein VDAG_09157 [Verticillium dahliae VdLs.17]EGY18631.1 hypothetical protein VDAG_09157 [Verticillium dahliae VdLs.17]